MTDTEFENIEIKQNRGPTLRFSGKLLAEDSHTTKGRDPFEIRMEIWATPAGALIAANYSKPADGSGFEDARATVVEPTIFDPENDEMALSILDRLDEQRMRFAVMDHFDWDRRARSMVRKQLKWSLVQEVS